MSQNISIAGAAYTSVPSINVPITGGGGTTAKFVDTSDANATAADIVAGKTAYVVGSMLTGTANYITAPAQLTSLPTSGTALTDNAEYRVSAVVGTYAFAWPTSPFECWLKFTTDATFAITFPTGTTYIGGAPTFAASKTYEMSVKDGTVIVQEVTTS